MLNIMKISNSKCQWCDGTRKKNGVLVQTYGCDIVPTMVMHNQQTGEKREMNKGHRFVWEERVFLCFNHFKKFALAMSPVRLGMHELAACGELDVNCASEEEAAARLAAV